MKLINKTLLLSSVLSINLIAANTSTELIVCTVKNLENANTFITKYLDKNKQVTIFKNKNKFLISYGKFNSKQEASLFINQLSKEVKKLKPYTKLMNSDTIVKKYIKEPQENKVVNNTPKQKLLNNISYPNKINYDIGFGINYGGLYGLSLSKSISDNIELYTSIGNTNVAGVGYSVGARYYMDNIRYTISHGTNDIIKFSDSSISTEKFKGINIGIGYGNRSSSWSADLMYLLTSDVEDRLEQLNQQGYNTNFDNRFKLNIGYRF